MTRIGTGRGLLGLLLIACSCAVHSQVAEDTYLVLQLSDPIPGQEAAFESAWSAHLRSQSALREVRSVEAFHRAAIRLREGARPMPSHLAVYRISAANLARTLSQIRGLPLRGNGAALSGLDPGSLQTLSYRLDGVWTQAMPAGGGDLYLQIVLADPTPGQSEIYDAWFRTQHGPQLATVPGVYEVDRGVRADVGVAQAGATLAPYSLSLMRFRTPDVTAFKDGLERAARDYIAPTTSYDQLHAWRETYQRQEPAAPADARP